MLRAVVSLTLCYFTVGGAGVQPVLNVIAEPPSVVDSVDFADAFHDVSVAAGKLARHAGERQHALDASVAAMLASQVPRSSVPDGTRPVALLEANSDSGSEGTPQLHIQPPMQNDEDVLAELDGVMQASQTNRKVADEIFAGDKQRMLDTEKAELRRIIREVFA